MLAIVGLLHEAGTATEDANIVVENSTGSASAPLRASPTLVWRSEGYTMKAAPGRGRSCQFGSVSHRAAGNSPTRARDNRMAATCCAHSDLGPARAQHSETGGRRFRHIYDSPLHKGAAVVDRHHGRSAIAQIFDENLRAEWQRAMRGRHGARVHSCAARRAYQDACPTWSALALLTVGTVAAPISAMETMHARIFDMRCAPAVFLGRKDRR